MIWALLVTLVATVLGPILELILDTKPLWTRRLEQIAALAVVGIILIGVLPETYATIGLLAIALAVVGFALPIATEKLLSGIAHQAHIATLVFGISGLILHASLDGAALSEDLWRDTDGLLGISVMLHRLPVGLMVWTLLYQSFGKRGAFIGIALVFLGTLAGYFAADQLTAYLNPIHLAYFEALVAGTILHVLVHQPDSHSH